MDLIFIEYYFIEIYLIYILLLSYYKKFSYKLNKCKIIF